MVHVTKKDPYLQLISDGALWKFRFFRLSSAHHLYELTTAEKSLSVIQHASTDVQATRTEMK